MSLRTVLALAVAVCAGLLAWQLSLPAESIAPPRAAQHALPVERAPSGVAPPRELAVADAVREPVVVGRRVRIVAVGERGAPVPGAEVRAVALPDAEAANGRDEAIATLRASAPIATTDAAGIADVTIDARSRVAVRSGTFAAERDVVLAADPFGDEPMPTLRFDLARDHTLRVLVTDPQGRPCAGVPVTAEVTVASRREGKQTMAVALGRTDARGLVELEQAQHAIPVFGDDVVAREVGVLAHAPSNPSSFVSDDDLLADRPTRLVVPAHGTIAVEAVDADGVPLEPHFGVASSVSPDEAWPESVVVEGARVLHRVPLQQTWTVHVRAADSEMTQPDVVGPQQPGEVVAVRVQLPVRRFEVQLRFVDTDGHEREASSMNDDQLPRSDYAGWTLRGARASRRLVLPAKVDSVPALTLNVWFEAQRAARVVRVPGPLRPGRNDLGDVVVPDEDGQWFDVAVLCEGRLLRDGVGFGVHGTPSPDAARQWLSSGARFVGGRHRIHVASPAEALELTVMHPDCVTIRCPLERGAGLQTVELQRRVVLHGRVSGVRAPSGTLAARLETDASPFYYGGGIEADGTFVVRAAMAGRYLLQIRADDAVLHEVKDLELRAGANFWPAAGTPIALGDGANAVFVDVREAVTGRRVASTCMLLTGGADGAGNEVVQRAAAGFLLPPGNVTEIAVLAAGYIPVCVPCPRADVRIDLQPAIELAFVAATQTRFSLQRVESGASHPFLKGIAALPLYPSAAPGHGLWTPVEFRAFVPGDVLEVVAERDGVRGATQRVVVGTASPQRVEIH